MSHARCKAVFPRDHLTTETLKQWAIPAYNLGNPMMDGLELKPHAPQIPGSSLTILLLPGSRSPEAYRNWELIVSSLTSLLKTTESIWFLAAIAPGLHLQPLTQILQAHHWQSRPEKVAVKPAILASQARYFYQRSATLVLTQQAYSFCLQRAEIAIAMTGTATEQFVGLGKPVITLPGQGPQFTPTFAEAQTRLLGCSVTLVQEPSQVAAAITKLRQAPEQLKALQQNGQQRMGQPGAAKRIALSLESYLVV